MHHYEYQSEFARKYVEEGRKEGVKEGRQEVLTKLLGLKFGELPDWASQRLRAADDTDLARWTERVLTAASLAAVFIGGTPGAQTNPMAWSIHKAFVGLYVKLGRIEGQRQMLVKIVRMKFGELPGWALFQLQAACALDIERWTERIFTAATLEDVFAD